MASSALGRRWLSTITSAGDRNGDRDDQRVQAVSCSVPLLNYITTPMDPAGRVMVDAQAAV